MNGTITIKAEETSKGTRVGIETRLKHADFEDRCMLVRCLCKAIKMTPHELVFCADMMDAGALDGDQETMVDLGTIQKAKEALDSES
jgi:hypothetical protein|nr:MAG TPA: hypothetical protein [Caudoviricetes sp.]